MARDYNVDICDWCTMTYPKGLYKYWEVYVFREHHKICDDCKKKLKRVSKD